MNAGGPTTLEPSSEPAPARPTAKAPAWYQQLHGTLGVSAQFVLEGNIHDRYLLPGDDCQEVKELAELERAVVDAHLELHHAMAREPELHGPQGRA